MVAVEVVVEQQTIAGLATAAAVAVVVVVVVIAIDGAVVACAPIRTASIRVGVVIELLSFAGRRCERRERHDGRRCARRRIAALMLVVVDIVDVVVVVVVHLRRRVAGAMRARTHDELGRAEQTLAGHRRRGCRHACCCRCHDDA